MWLKNHLKVFAQFFRHQWLLGSFASSFASHPCNWSPYINVFLRNQWKGQRSHNDDEDSPKDGWSPTRQPGEGGARPPSWRHTVARRCRKHSYFSNLTFLSIFLSSWVPELLRLAKIYSCIRTTGVKGSCGLYILPLRQSGSNCRPAGTGAASWQHPLVPTPPQPSHLFFLFSSSYLLVFVFVLFINFCVFFFTFWGSVPFSSSCSVPFFRK